MKSSAICSNRGILVVVVQCLLALIPSSLTEGNENILTQSELRAKYGQAGTAFNDGKSCYRTCVDGETKTCYFKFHVQPYDTMSGLCGACENGTIADCFNAGCVTASGLQRVIMTVNQKLPGPEINCCRNDRIIVDVKNHLAGHGLTIHWHGVPHRDTPWFDGVPMVTQCPINQGNSFRYVFTAAQAGSHIYHAATGSHRTNGVMGKLTVRDALDPHANACDYDLAEHQVLLTDWDNTMAENKEPGIRSRPTQPDALLINGFGSYSNPRTNQNAYAPIAAFYVERGKKHRFRIANAGSYDCQLELSIQGHKLTVIATGGSSVEALAVDSLVSLPGERYDFILHATNDTNIRETLMTARALRDCRPHKIQEFARIFVVDDIFKHGRVDADHEPLKERPAFEALDAPKISLSDPQTDCLTSDSYCVAALQQMSTTPTAENLRNVPAKQIRLDLEFVEVKKRPHNYITYEDGAYLTTINRIANVQPSVPVLTQDDSHMSYCNADKLPKTCDIAVDNRTVCQCSHLIELELGQVYEFLLVNKDPGFYNVHHTLHLHGMAFQIVDMGTLDQLESGKTAYTNAEHFPVAKDTVAVPSASFVKIRFRTSNPGYWMLRSHIDFCIQPGMAVTLKVGQRNEMKAPPADFPKCGDYFAAIVEESKDEQ